MNVLDAIFILVVLPVTCVSLAVLAAELSGKAKAKAEIEAEADADAAAAAKAVAAAAAEAACRWCDSACGPQGGVCRSFL